MIVKRDIILMLIQVNVNLVDKDVLNVVITLIVMIQPIVKI